MARSQLALFLILLAVPAVGQRPAAPVEVRAPDGRTVILKPDGTWEYKTEAPAPAPKTATPINPVTPETLPPNFTGDDVTTLVHQLVDLRKRLVKSEFETSAAYEARVAEEKKKPVVGNRTVQETFYLVASGVKAEYNADTQVMSFSLPVEMNLMAEMGRGRNTPEDKKRSTDLSRVTLYRVSLGGYSDPRVFFDDTTGLPLTGDRYEQRFSAKINLDVEGAKRLKTNTKALLIVRFEEPYAIERHYSNDEFQTSLIDVQFFDPQSGKVLAKLGSAALPNSAQTAPQKKNRHLEKAQELYNARRDDEAEYSWRAVILRKQRSMQARRWRLIQTMLRRSRFNVKSYGSCDVVKPQQS